MHTVVSLNADSIIIGVYYCFHLHMFDGGGAGNLWTDSKLKVCMSLLALASPLPFSEPGPWPAVPSTMD